VAAAPRGRWWLLAVGLCGGGEARVIGRSVRWFQVVVVALGGGVVAPPVANGCGEGVKRGGSGGQQQQQQHNVGSV
jgi:hypothetical protein